MTAVPAATRYPGVGPRAAATVVDAAVGYVVVALPIALLAGRHAAVHRDHDYSVSVGITGPLAVALWIAAVLAYYVVFEAWLGATPGKLVLGLRVRGLGGARPSPRAAAIRNVLRLVDAFPYVIPYLVAAVAVWSDHDPPAPQRLGDRAARTIVTYR